MRKKGFTLIELLVVVAIIAILIAILLPAVSKAKEYGRKVSCGSNLKQMAIAFQNYADDFNDLYPPAWGDQKWEYTYDDPANPEKYMGWMRRLHKYVGYADKIYKCPSFARNSDSFNYFLSGRAAFARAYADGMSGYNLRQSVRRGWIEFPSAFILAGDCNNADFPETDCDRDDYSQQCLGWKSVIAATENSEKHWWEPWHDGGLNVLFADSHVKWFTENSRKEMTYSYNDYTDWAGALPNSAGNI